MNELLDLSKVPENDRLAFYGALFAIANADGQIDKDEMECIFGLMDLENMSEEAKRQVQSHIIEPPDLEQCLRELSYADEKLRYALMINLVETASANEEVDPDEKEAILLAKQELNVSNEQLKAIISFVNEMKRVRARGLDDDQAADAVKAATAGLGAVGVPIAAVYFSGSVVGLSAAGITSGLASLGLGFGMVPGIGVAVLAGAGIFWGISQVLDLGGGRAKEEEMRKRERKAELVIKNMQGAINQLLEQITHLQAKSTALESSAADAEANREAIKRLTERLKFMQQSVARRKYATGGV